MEGTLPPCSIFRKQPFVQATASKLSTSFPSIVLSNAQRVEDVGLVEPFKVSKDFKKNLPKLSKKLSKGKTPSSSTSRIFEGLWGTKVPWC